MCLEIGTIVKNLNGKGKNSYFCVVEQEGDYVLLADGKSRKFENPKRKKIKHIQITNKKMQAATFQVNKHLKKAIDSLMNF